MFACGKTCFFGESGRDGCTAVDAESLPSRNFAATVLALDRQGRPAVPTKVPAVYDIGPTARAKHAVLPNEAESLLQPAYLQQWSRQSSKTSDTSLLGTIEVVFVSADRDRAVYSEA